jgi:hypothetical protein
LLRARVLFEELPPVPNLRTTIRIMTLLAFQADGNLAPEPLSGIVAARMIHTDLRKVLNSPSLCDPSESVYVNNNTRVRSY